MAFQYIAKFAFGDLPFQLMNYCDIRGYNKNRYIDKKYLACNVEYRFPVFWRIGGVLFAGAGEVASGIGDFSFKFIRPAAGFGLRLMLDKDEHINLRFDLGFSNYNRCEAYVNLTEAF